MVYSTLFAQAEVPVSPGVFYTVPDGFVAVLRCVDGLGPLDGSELVLSEAVANENWASVAGESAGDFLAYRWRGRQVFDEGQELQWGTVSPFLFARASGYLLSAP